jgi:hypothetical protein
MVPTTPAIQTTEAQGEPAPAYEGPSEPREEGGSQGNALDMILSQKCDVTQTVSLRDHDC